MHPDWVLSLRNQCNAVGVPFFFKQWGEWAPSYGPAGQISAPFRSGDMVDLDIDGRILNGIPGHGTGHWAAMVRVGKVTAGRILYGREWSDFPEGTS
jgi:hypothetical protein